MDPLLVIIGLFLFFAIYSNKDIRENEANRDLYMWFSMFTIIIVCSGLGFLVHILSTNGSSGLTFLMPMWVGFAAISVCATGNTKVLARISAYSVVVYTIMGSFM